MNLLPEPESLANESKDSSNESDEKLATKNTMQFTLRLQRQLGEELHREREESGLSITEYLERILMNRRMLDENTFLKLENRCNAAIADFERVSREKNEIERNSVKYADEIEELLKTNSVLSNQLEAYQAVSDENAIQADTKEIECEALEKQRESLEKECESLREKLSRVMAEKSRPKPEPVESPKNDRAPTEQSDSSHSEKLRQIILENTYLSNSDIDQLIHEDSNY